MEWFTSNVLSVVLPALVGIILTAVGTWVSGVFASRVWEKVKEWRFAPYIKIAWVAVGEVYKDYVRELKLAASDGKLTKTEIAAANDKAIHLIDDKCRAAGLTTLTDKIGNDKAKALVDMVVDIKKTKEHKGKVFLRNLLKMVPLFT